MSVDSDAAESCEVGGRATRRLIPAPAAGTLEDGKSLHGCLSGVTRLCDQGGGNHTMPFIARIYLLHNQLHRKVVLWQ